jgi:hypothetical protein
MSRDIAVNDYSQHADNHLHLDLQPCILSTENNETDLSKSSVAVDEDEVGAVFASVAQIANNFLKFVKKSTIIF